MNKNKANKSSNSIHQKSNKSLNKVHIKPPKENKNRIQNKNKLRKYNKGDLIYNNSNNKNIKINTNIRAKSNTKNIGNKEKNKSNMNIKKNNSNPIKKNLTGSNEVLNNISSLNPHQKKPKVEINNENINTNILTNTNPNTNHALTNPNKNENTFNINFNNKFKSDINNPFFLKRKQQKDLAKTENKKINIKFNNKEDDTSIPNFENLKYISLEDTNALFNAWQHCSIIYKLFEEKIMKKNDFEINKNTLELITKNSEACKELKDQKFWILYIEYLINNNLLTNENQFITVINEAFSYMTYNCTQLRIYYLQKIKKYAPVILSDGTFDDSDETYINKLNPNTISFIKRQKGVISSNVKLKSANKRKNCKLENKNQEYKEIIKDNKINRLINNGGNM